MHSSLSRRTFGVSAAAAALGVHTCAGPPAGQSAEPPADPPANSPRGSVSPNESIGLGYIACGGRANELMTQFEQAGGSHVAAVCDVDPHRVGVAKQRFENANAYSDLRRLIDDASVDAVVIAACNHWHSLAAIWAMQAGKHVYVEKPLSHSQWEGAQTVAAARKYDRICQVGTQQRSCPMQAEIKQFLHRDKTLGEILSVRVNRFGVRRPIGRREQPLSIQPDFAHDLWLGPAADLPLHRDSLHYDWHWHWNTGNGEMGNWGVHVLDDVRNVVFEDRVGLPRRIAGGGGRVVWDDAGETPNVHWVQFDTGSIPVTIALSNLPAQSGGTRSPVDAYAPGPSSGYMVHCENGHLHGQRGKAEAFDRSGQSIAKFAGPHQVVHQANFIDALRSGDRHRLNADVAIGNDSTGWCNLANIAFRAGSPGGPSATSGSTADDIAAGITDGMFPETLAQMRTHLAVHDVSLGDPSIQMSDWLRIDADTGRFTGAGSDRANALLRRDYRSGFEVPAII